MTSRVMTMLGYAVLALALLVVELVARREDSRVPRLSQVIRWAMRRRSAQFGLVLAWWWLGWHFILAI